MNRSLLAILLLVAVLGCGRSPYPGHRTIGEGVHLKLIALGEGEFLATDTDSVFMRIRVAGLGEAPGSLFSTERTYSAADLRTGAFEAVLAMLHEGDSVSVISTAKLLPWAVVAPEDVPKPSDTLTVQIGMSLLRITTPAMWRAEQEWLRRNDPAGFERRVIARYIHLSGMEWTQWGTSDMYYRITGDMTDTARVRKGDVITMAYTGRRLEDGQVIDATERNGDLFSFRFGDKDQVVRGVEVAVSLLRPGQTGNFLIPSEMAFGAKGIESVVEPYTAVEYSVSIEGVERSGTATSR